MPRVTTPPATRAASWTCWHRPAAGTWSRTRTAPTPPSSRRRRDPTSSARSRCSSRRASTSPAGCRRWRSTSPPWARSSPPRPTRGSPTRTGSPASPPAWASRLLPRGTTRLSANAARLRRLAPPWGVGLDPALPARTLVLTAPSSALYAETAESLVGLGAAHLTVDGAGHRVQDDPRTTGPAAGALAVLTRRATAGTCLDFHAGSGTPPSDRGRGPRRSHRSPRVRAPLRGQQRPATPGDQRTVTTRRDRERLHRHGHLWSDRGARDGRLPIASRAAPAPWGVRRGNPRGIRGRPFAVGSQVYDRNSTRRRRRRRSARTSGSRSGPRVADEPSAGHRSSTSDGRSGHQPREPRPESGRAPVIADHLPHGAMPRRRVPRRASRCRRSTSRSHRAPRSARQPGRRSCDVHGTSAWTARRPGTTTLGGSGRRPHATPSIIDVAERRGDAPILVIVEQHVRIGDVPDSERSLRRGRASVTPRAGPAVHCATITSAADRARCHPSGGSRR